MGLQEWLADFCALHEKAGAGQLRAEERKKYLASRDELARALLKAQQISLYPGQAPRTSLRAALAVPVEIQLPGSPLQTLTRDLSSGGFSVILPGLLGVGSRYRFVMKLGRGQEPVEGYCKVADCQGLGTKSRVGFSFEGVGPGDTERVEFMVFDVVVAQLKPPPATPQ